MHKLTLTAILLSASAFTQVAVQVHPLDAFNDQHFKAWSQSIKTLKLKQDPEKQTILEFTIPAETRLDSVNFDLLPDIPKFHEWEELQFDYKISQPKLDWFGLKITDKPLLDGWQAVWQLSIPPNADTEWQTATIPLQQPQWKWGDGPTDFRCIYFRYSSTLKVPTTVTLGNLRLVRKNIFIKLANPDEPVKHTDKGFLLPVTLRNTTDKAVTCKLQTSSSSEAYTAAPAQQITIEPGEHVVNIPFNRVADVPPLTSLALKAELFNPDDTISFASVATGAVTPFSNSFKLPSPCLWATPEQLAVIRERIKNDQKASDWWGAFQKNCDELVARTITYPPRGAQWWHWYSCKKCGTNLKTESPTRHVCPNCKEVYSGWPYDDVILSRDHDALAHGIANLGLAYQISHNRAYADKARDIAIGYAERYLKYPLHDINDKPTAGGGHVHPQTLDEAIWLISICRGIDAIRETLSQKDFDYLADNMIRPAAMHIYRHAWGIHNICCWQASAYGLAGLLLNRGDLVQAAVYGPKGFLNQIDKGITADGQWYERAWGYHFYTMSALAPLAVAIHNTKLCELPPKYKLLYDAPFKLLSPSNHLPAFHDSGRVYFGPSDSYEVAFAWWGDPKHGDFIKRTNRNSLAAIIWGASEVKTDACTYESENLTDVGYAVLRTDPKDALRKPIPQNFVVMDYGEHGGGHGHPDKLNFVLWAHNTLLSEDPGCIAYGNPAHGGWYRQTISHNTLIVDGESQTPATGRSLAFAKGDNAALSVAEAGNIYKGVRACRALALVDDVFIDILWADADQPHQFDYAFHSRGDFTASIAGTPCEPPKGVGATYAKNWTTTPHNGAFNAVWNYEGVTLSMAQCSSQPGTLLTADGMGNPATVFFRQILNRIENTKTFQVASAFSFNGIQPAVERLATDETIAAVKAVIGNETYFFFVSKDGTSRSFTCNGNTYTAKALLLKQADGIITQVLLDNN